MGQLKLTTESGQMKKCKDAGKLLKLCPKAIRENINNWVIIRNNCCRKTLLYLVV